MSGELIFALWFATPTIICGIVAYAVLKKDYQNALKRETANAKSNII